MEAAGLSWSVIALAVAVVLLANAIVWVVFRRMSRPRGRTPVRRVTPMLHDMAELRAEVDRLKLEIQAMKAPKSNASPYNQAQGMAQEGFSAAEVAARCGITRGEAELLVALFGKTKISGLE